MAKIQLNYELDRVLNLVGGVLKSELTSDLFSDSELGFEKADGRIVRFSRKLVDGKIGVFFFSDDEKFLVVSGSRKRINSKIYNVAMFYWKKGNIWKMFGSYSFQYIEDENKTKCAYSSSKVRNLLKRIASEDSTETPFEMRMREIHVTLNNAV